MNAIAPIAMGFGEMERLAVSIAKSNMFGMKTPEQALVLMAISQAEGRHPALAARDYDIIQNRPAKKAEAMLRDFLEGGGKVEWHALSDSIADATFSHPQGGTVRITWDMQRATQAGLGGKDNWKKFPRQMLRSRMVSEGVRTVWPTATSGMYVAEEVADMPAKEPPHNGPTIEHEKPPATIANGNSRRDEINRETPMGQRAAAAAAPRPPRQVATTAYDTAWLAPLDEQDPAVWIVNLERVLAACTSQTEVTEAGGHVSVRNAVSKAPTDIRRRVSELLATHFARMAPPAEQQEGDGWPSSTSEEAPAEATA
jgi:hypothetical protein